MSLEELDHRFRDLNTEYQGLKQRSEAKVVIWKWARHSRHDPRPFWYERNRWGPGHYLKSPPARPNGLYEYGYDVQGNIVVGRNHVCLEPDRMWFYETFYIRDREIVDVFHFNYAPEKDPVYLAQCHYEGTRLVLWESRAAQGSTREIYHWDKKRISLIEVDYAKVRTDQTFEEPTPWQRIEPRYDKAGHLERLTVRWLRSPELPTETEETVYRRLDKSISLRTLLSLAQEKLFSRIKDRLIALNLRDTAYCLAIVWSPGQFRSLPPQIGLGLERDRAKWISAHGREAKWYLWNPAEFSFGVIDTFDFHDEEMTKIFELLNQECGRRNCWNRATKMLNGVAKLLNHIDWHGNLPTTSDFVAYSTDVEIGDLRKNLKFAIAPDLYKRFAMNGWLP